MSEKQPRADATRKAAGPPGDTTGERTGLTAPDEEFLQPASEGNLADRGSLLDEDGEDIRQYTGEPVETEDGWVVPQQQNVGPGNMAGGGEWPDPDTPSKQPKPWKTAEEEATQRRNEGTL